MTINQIFFFIFSEAIKSETGGNYKNALLACVELPAVYWANRINQSVKGLGTNDALLIRCFTENDKPFLQEVAIEYKKLFKVTLEKDIKGDTSGHYCELFMTLLDLPENEKSHYKN